MGDYRKLTFDKINIEVTRRCNMSCKHCFRGQAQDIDIDTKYIDSLLNQTEIIGSLFFTGGEPTLCLDKMQYFIDKLYKKRIPLFEFGIVTNGLIFNNDIVDIIKQYSKLVTLCREIGCNYDLMPKYMNVTVGVSLDKFHSNREVVENNFEKYKKALDGFAQVKKIAIGNVYRREGNAKFLSGGTSVIGLEDNFKKRIEILDKDHKPLCPQYKTYKLIKPEQIQICCDMYLSCHGNLLFSAMGMHEYPIVDFDKCIICNVCDSDIYSSILEYNKGRIDCLTLTKTTVQEMIKNPWKNFRDNLYLLTHKDDDDSEMIFANKSPGYSDTHDIELQALLNPGLIDELIREASSRNYTH